MPLTPEIVQALRKPFEPELIKWKIQTNPKEGQDKAIVVAFIDSRDVTERLDLATGGDWSSEFSLPQVNAGAQFSLECALTVCGVTRRDVGTVAQPRQGEDATKDLYSNALKRAAVQFGVGSHVYRFPKVKAKVQASGKSYYLTFRAADELLMLNRQLIQGGKPNKYTDIEVRGSSYGAGGIEYSHEETNEPEQKSQISARDGETRFFARYAEAVGGVEWVNVQSFLNSRAPKPTTIEGWIAAAEAVKDKLN